MPPREKLCPKGRFQETDIFITITLNYVAHRRCWFDWGERGTHITPFSILNLPCALRHANLFLFRSNQPVNKTVDDTCNISCCHPPWSVQYLLHTYNLADGDSVIAKTYGGNVYPLTSRVFNDFRMIEPTNIKRPIVPDSVVPITPLLSLWKYQHRHLITWSDPRRLGRIKLWTFKPQLCEPSDKNMKSILLNKIQ